MANTQPPRNPNLKSIVRIRTVIAVSVFLHWAASACSSTSCTPCSCATPRHYRTEAVTQQLQDTELPATRGNIYSANGKLLAKSNTVWNIIADPAAIREERRDGSARSAPVPSISPNCWTTALRRMISTPD